MIEVNYAVPEMITLKEASKRTGVSYDFLRKMCLSNQIVHVKAGAVPCELGETRGVSQPGKFHRCSSETVRSHEHTKQGAVLSEPKRCHLLWVGLVS